MTAPIFKWAGRKSRLLKKYEAFDFYPDSSQFDTFVDLFAGSGAVTCAVADRYPDKKLVFNDNNVELMAMFMQLRDNWPEFRDHYLRISEVFLATPVERRKALYNCYKRRYAYNYKLVPEAELMAGFLVMLKTNFNGMWKTYKKYGYRYSSAPGNVTYTPRIFDIDAVESFKDTLLRATVTCGSFEDVVIPDNSWVYADPPYRDSLVTYQHVDGMIPDEFTDSIVKKLKESNGLYALSNKEIGDGFWFDRFGEGQVYFMDHKYTCGYGQATNKVTEVLIKNY